MSNLAYHIKQETQIGYYPFGSVMKGREFSNISASARYGMGFNGKRMDNEVYGDGNIYDYGFRIYDPRVGRFLSTDPLFQSYPWYTPYQFAGNNPILFIDLDGLEHLDIKSVWNKRIHGYETVINVISTKGELTIDYKVTDPHGKVSKFTTNKYLTTGQKQSGDRAVKDEKEHPGIFRNYRRTETLKEEIAAIERTKLEATDPVSPGAAHTPPPSFEGTVVRPGATFSKTGIGAEVGMSPFPTAGNLSDESKARFAKLGEAIRKNATVKEVDITITSVQTPGMSPANVAEHKRQLGLYGENIKKAMGLPAGVKVKIHVILKKADTAAGNQSTTIKLK